MILSSLGSLSIFAVALLPVALLAGGNNDTPKKNPLVGTWEWVSTNNSCRETYTFERNGKSFIVSGAEVSEGTYNLSNKSSTGFYKLSIKITKDHGGKDCSDERVDNTGQEYMNYITFDPSESMYVICEKEATDSCLGSLRKIE